MGKVRKKGPTFDASFKLRKGNQHFPWRHVNALFKMGDFHLVSRHVVVTLEDRKCRVLCRGATKRHDLFGDSLHLPHGDLALDRIHRAGTDHDMANLVGERVHNDPAHLPDFTVRTSNFGFQFRLHDTHFILMGFGVLTEAFL